MAWRSLRILAATLSALLVGGAVALADGDPASDVLLTQNVFYPYASPASPAIQADLNAAAAAGCRARFPIKVALIASSADLGAVSNLFGKPQSYADFLEQELSPAGKQPLLVVMATGYGGGGLSARAERAAASLPKPASATGNDLVRAATGAVAKIAAADGHPITGSPRAPCSDPISEVNHTNLEIIIAALIVIGLCAAVAARRTGRPTAA